MARFELDRILGDKKAEVAFLALACSFTILYRGWGLFSTIASGIPDTSHISYDGVYYAQIARNILFGQGLGWEAMVFPVLQPILVAAVSFATGIDNLPLLARYLNLIAGVALLVPAYYLAREYFGRTAAFATVIILIPYPHLVAVSSGDTAESLYAFTICISLYAAYVALERNSRLYMLLTGAGLGVTYLARPEGLNIFCMFLAIAAWRTVRAAGAPEAAKKLGLAVAGFAVFALPYTAFLTHSYGRVILSPKLPYESMVMKYKVYKEPVDMREVDGLTRDGKLIWQEKGGADVLLNYFRQDPERFVRAYGSNLESELPWRVRNSTHMQGYPIVYPLYFWLPAIIGFVMLLRDPADRWKAALIYVPFVNLFVYPIFTEGFWIYHVPYVAFLVVLAAGGYIRISRALTSVTGVAVPLLLVVAVLSAGYSSYVRFSSKPEKAEVMSYRKLLSDEAIKVGETAGKRLGPGSTYMMRWSRLVYYLGGRWLNLPAVMPREAVVYGSNNGADYLVEEMVGEAALGDSFFTGTPGLRLAYMYQSPVTPYQVLIWKIDTRSGGQANR